jgi:acetolactate synthase-1/2/3 large subunit
MIFTTGVGNHQLLAAQYLKMRKPKRFITSGGFGTMGFGMPSAIGAYYANKNSQVIVIDGDGSFRMNMGELHTIGTLKLPVKILLLNNTADGMVFNLEDVAYGGRHSATVRQADVNFAQMAGLCFFKYAKRIDDKANLEQELDAFLKSEGPALLEVKTDIDEALFPVVRAGKSYHDMELGPFIKKVNP